MEEEGHAHEQLDELHAEPHRRGLRHQVLVQLHLVREGDGDV